MRPLPPPGVGATPPATPPATPRATPRATAPGGARLAWAFVRLRYRLLRGAIRHGGADQVGAVLSIVASAVIGVAGGIGAVAVATTVEAPTMVVLLCTGLVLAVVGFGTVAGVSQPIDPRVVAAEPLAPGDRAIGLLAGAALGPAGLAGIAIGTGLAVGALAAVGPTPTTVPIVIAAVASWLMSLLLVARTATNLLALLIARRARVGQLVAGLGGLVFYGLFQLVPAVLADADRADRARLAAGARWSPPGQIGAALIEADDATVALGHLALGSVWLAPLAVGFVMTTARLSVAVRTGGGRGTRPAHPFAQVVRRACGPGVVGAIAWRSLLTRFRTTRTALETVTGAGVGLAAVLGPVLLRDDPGSGAVLVGGAVQLAVLFVAGNNFGNDGPAAAYELLAGATARDLVEAKVRSTVILAAPLAAVGPIIAAAITGEWQYLAAGFGIGVGGLLAGSGAAVVQSALVPIAVPESDNPFASGESGKGILAAGLLLMVLLGLAVATLPIGLALFWAVDRGRTGLVSVFAAVTVVAGWAVQRLGARLATGRIDGRDPEFVASLTPAR